jgi:hypothetical protein
MPRPAVEAQVEKHLKKIGVDPNKLPDGVIEALNGCSAAELQAMENVGASMETANLDLKLRVYSVH